jgi:hypothetical protein
MSVVNEQVGLKARVPIKGLVCIIDNQSLMRLGRERRSYLQLLIHYLW